MLRVEEKYRPSNALVHQDIMSHAISYPLILGAEEVANRADVKPTTRMLLELDCHGRMLRNLSIWIAEGGDSHSNDTPWEWSHIAPDTNAFTLLKLVCTETKASTAAK
jgi:hypothetical protein